MRLVLPPFLVLSAALFAATRQPDATPTTAERAAIDAIAKAGGQGEIDPKLGPTGRVAAKFDTATDVTLSGLKKHAQQIGAVDVFDAKKCTDKGLGAFKELPNLRQLALGKSEMTPTRVNVIAQCKELRDLRLPNSGLRNAHLVALKKLTRLEQLDLSENELITDEGMASVKTLERLRALYLSKTAITDRGLMELKGLEGLRTLYAGSTKVTAEGAEKFVDEMPNLRVVRR